MHSGTFWFQWSQLRHQTRQTVPTSVEYKVKRRSWNGIEVQTTIPHIMVETKAQKVDSMIWDLLNK